MLDYIASAGAALRPAGGTLNTSDKMQSTISRPAKPAGCIVGCIALGVVVLVLLNAAHFILTGGCLTETAAKFYNMSGFNFEVRYLNCDVIAKQEWVEVLVAKGASTRQTLLLKYTESRYADPLPAIKSMGNNRFRILVPRVSTLDYRLDRWEMLTFDYDIGTIDYPANKSDPK